MRGGKVETFSQTLTALSTKKKEHLQKKAAGGPAIPGIAWADEGMTRYYAMAQQIEGKMAKVDPRKARETEWKVWEDKIDGAVQNWAPTEAEIREAEGVLFKTILVEKLA